MWLEYALAAALFAVNIVLTLVLPYFTSHSHYYDSGAYIVVLAIAFAIYTLHLLTAKKIKVFLVKLKTNYFCLRKTLGKKLYKKSAANSQYKKKRIAFFYGIA